jgi:hypothetical protein
MPLKSDRQLKTYFNDFNRRWFNGELPETQVFWEALGGATMGDCLYLEEEKVWRIRLNPFVAGWRNVYKVTLLHEMVHIKTGEAHGLKFDRERQRLLEFKAVRKLVI